MNALKLSYHYFITLIERQGVPPTLKLSYNRNYL
jgi:hypothetical protein